MAQLKHKAYEGKSQNSGKSDQVSDMGRGYEKLGMNRGRRRDNHKDTVRDVGNRLDATLSTATRIEEGYEFIHGTRGLREPQQGKKQRKRMLLQDRYEELKPIVPYPELFELEDATCMDPVLHNKMKGCRGSVPVPGYWKSNTGRMFPRNYEKPRYKVPMNIVSTGIPELRKMLREKEAGMSLRAKIKERLYPRLGKSLVDQQTLYDAFFQNHRKPYMTKHGEVFHPGLEYFTKRYSPGMLSSELMEALEIDDKSPPPWLFNMQKYGMPPSYPNAKIPGLNSPIPDGCSYGYQPKGWGEAPTTLIGMVEEEVGPKHTDTIYNEENQYTKLIYAEELEERISRDVSGVTLPEASGNSGVFSSESQVEEVEAEKLPKAGPESKEEPKMESEKKKRVRKEKLYKNVRF